MAALDWHSSTGGSTSTRSKVPFKAGERDGLVEVVVYKAVGRRGEVLEPRVKLEQVEIVAEQSLVERGLVPNSLSAME